MRTKSIVNCCIVVVRYFGGVLLGTGGLVRSYTQSAQAALQSAGIAKMELTCVEHCEVPYSVWDKIRYASERLPVRIENIQFGASVGFQLLFRSCDRDTVVPKITDAAERKMKTDMTEEIFSAWCIE
jgi:putative IMPACT (imprinted ancient) family translation regulator